MKKKLLVIPLIACLWGGSMIYAATEIGRIVVSFNNKTTDEQGVLVNGKVYLPVSEATDDAITNWDAKENKLTIYKPNVHMFLFSDQKVFGKVKAGNSITFSVFAQIDNLLTDISAVKITISDPQKNEKPIQSEDIREKKDNFWFLSKDTKFSFDTAGKYEIRFYMKPSFSSEWFLVSEKQIVSE